jgi:hypothetical protein
VSLFFSLFFSPLLLFFSSLLPTPLLPASSSRIGPLCAGLRTCLARYQFLLPAGEKVAEGRLRGRKALH